MKTSTSVNDGRLSTRRNMAQLQSFSVYKSSSRRFSSEVEDEPKIVKFQIKKREAKPASSASEDEQIGFEEEGITQKSGEPKVLKKFGEGATKMTFFDSAKKEMKGSGSEEQSDGLSELNSEEELAQYYKPKFAFSDQEREYRRRQVFGKVDRHRADVADPRTGGVLPIMNSEEESALMDYKNRLAEAEPKIVPNFDKDLYNDWKKEVDKQTIQTHQKMEHYKQSEQLLNAIKTRLQSANTENGQKELQEYLLSKIGYKDTNYTDFMGNSLTQKTQEAQEETRNTAILKGKQEAQDEINYNDNQVRDSHLLGGKHAWSRDRYVPASEVDMVTAQKKRRLITSQEYYLSRQRDENDLMQKQLLWDTEIDRMNKKQLAKLVSRKTAFAEVTDGATVFREIMKDLVLTPEERKYLSTPQQLHLKTIQDTWKEMEAATKQEEEIIKQIEEEETAIDAKQDEVDDMILKNLQEDEAVDPDTIKTESDVDDRNFDYTDGVTMSSEEIERQERNKAMDTRNSSELSEIEEKQGAEIHAHAYNVVSDSEMERAEAFIAENPEKALELDEITREIEDINANISSQSDFDDGNSHEGHTDSALEEKEMLFFEKEAQYKEFARAFLKENAEGKTKEEAEKLEALQQEVRDKYLPERRDSSYEDGSDLNFNLHKYDSAEWAELERDRDIFASSSSMSEDTALKMRPNESKLREIDLTRALLLDRGTWEGERRFERIDRVSKDGVNDKLDQIKLRNRHERVYDPAAAAMAEDRPEVIHDSLVNQDFIEDRLTTLEDDTPDHAGRVWETVEFHNREPTPIPLDELYPELSPQVLDQAAQEWKPILQNIKEQTSHKPVVPDKVGPHYDFESILNLKEAAEMVNIPGEASDIIARQSGFTDQMQQEYAKAQQLNDLILEARKDIGTRVQAAQQKLNKIHEDLPFLMSKLRKFNRENVEGQVVPNLTQFDFIGEKRTTSFKAKQSYLNFMTTNKIEFNSKSTNAADYEQELFTISKMGLLKTKKQREELLAQYEFVFDCMKTNKIEATANIKGSMFEYLVVRNDFELAQDQLKSLTSDLTESQSPIDTRYLTLYLKNCLQHDQIDGVAYLVNYCRRYNVDCSEMPLEKFHNMLDFYLNHTFDLSKVMIFSKFYKKFYEDKINLELSKALRSGIKPGQFNEQQLKSLKEQIFNEHENLVDMRSLSKFLVTKTGDRQIIDPLTKEDSLWGLIDLFTQSPDVYEASRLSNYNHIEPATIAQYFANRFAKHDSLDKVIKVAFRLNNTNVGRDFAKAMIDQLKTYQAQRHGALPESFSKHAVKDMYYKLRATKAELDLHQSEMLLYILQQKGMHAEVIDFCSNRKDKAEIVQYYLTESLLSLPIKSGSYKAALDPLLEDTSSEACRLTQQTKAIMLDNGPEAAYTYFTDEFSKFEDKANQKKAFLVSLYDKMMPQSEAGVSEEEFKEKYFQSSQLAAKFAKEAFVVNQMEQMLSNKDFDQIDNLFNLYTVMREERQLLHHEYVLNEHAMSNIDDQLFKKVTKANEKRLAAVRERKDKLQKKVGLTDVQALKKVEQIMQDEELSVFNEASGIQIRKTVDIFNDMSADEAAEIEKRNRLLWNPEELKPDSVVNKLVELGHDKDFVDRIFEADLIEVNKDTLWQLPRRNKRIKDFEAMNPEELDKLAKLQSDYKALMAQIDNPTTVLKLMRSMQKDEAYKKKAQNFMFGTSSEDERTEDHFTAMDAKELKSKIEDDQHNLDTYETLGFFPDHMGKMEYRERFGDIISSGEDAALKELEDANSSNSEEVDEAIRKFINKEVTIPSSGLSEGEQEVRIDLDQTKAQGRIIVSSLNSSDVILTESAAKTGDQTGDQPEGNFIKIKMPIIDREKNPRTFQRMAQKALERIELKKAAEEYKEKQAAIDVYQKNKLEDRLANSSGEEFDCTTTPDETDMEMRMQNSEDEFDRGADLEYLIDNMPGRDILVDDLSETEDKLNPGKVMKRFWETVEANTDYYMRKNKDRYTNPYPDETYFSTEMDRIHNQLMRQERPEYDYEWQHLEFKMPKYPQYNRELEKNGVPASIPDNWIEKEQFEKIHHKIKYEQLKPEDMDKEPDAVRSTMHDASIMHLKEELMHAMNKRKYEALPIMIEMFNRIQRKKLGDPYRLEDFEKQNVKDFSILDKNAEILGQGADFIDIDNYGETLKKLDMLLYDSRSPLLSALNETKKYKTDQLPEDVRDYYITPESMVIEPVDIGAFRRDVDKLQILQFEMDRITHAVQQVSTRVTKSIRNVGRDPTTPYQKNKQEQLQQKEIQEKNDARIRVLCHEFNQRQTDENNKVSDETKVRIMRDVLALELGQSFNVNADEERTASTFPVFYALDLINFGIKRDQPAAIRLGEKLLADSCDQEHAQLPTDVAIAIKNYMLDYKHNQGYRDAMKITGPINSSKIYHMANQKPGNSGTQNTLALDDPYWQDFMVKNRRREDMWRRPSMFAYRYKPYGIIGEIVDMQHVQKKYDQYFGQK